MKNKKDKENNETYNYKNIDLKNIKDPDLVNYILLLEQYKKVVDSSNIVSKTDKKGIITYANERFTDISEYHINELIGKNHNIIRHPDMPSEAFKELWDTISAKKTWHGIIKNKKKNGGYYIVDSTVIPIVDSKNEVIEYIAIRKDITRLIEQSKRIRRQLTDQLTGLPNQNKLSEDFTKSREKTIILLNIDLFREIIEFYGETIAHQVLKSVAVKLEKLTAKIFPDFHLYKLSGDEYAIYRGVLYDHGLLQEKITAILDELHEHNLCKVDDIEIHYSISLGAYTGSEEHALNKSKIALKYARENRLIHFIYSDTLRNQHNANLTAIRFLKHAIANNKIIPYYQPILNNRSGKIEKYESLVRIVDKNGELVLPIEFLSSAKKSKLYPYITKSVIENVIKMSAKMDLEFSINLSVEDIINPKTKKMILDTIMVYTQTHQNKLIFEIIESENIENFKEMSDFFTEAKKMGCKIAIDDFGSGYSNFEYLTELHVDFIKIDGSLIKRIDKDPIQQTIVKTILAFAKEMNILTVAEYIHSKEVFDTVKALGVDYSQGFYIGEPEKLEL